MLRAFASIVLFALASATVADDARAPAVPKTPQESAARYFAAIAAEKTPDPAPMMISKFKMPPEQVANHARMLSKQLKDKVMKPGILVAGQKAARVISTLVTHSNGESSVVYIDLEKEGDGWLISDVNCLVASQLNSIIQGFKETKDPQAVVRKLK